MKYPSYINTIKYALAASILSACSVATDGITYKDPILSQPIQIDKLYSQQGSDQSWQQLLQTDDLKPLRSLTTHGSKGAKVDVNNQLIETGPYANNPINSANRKMRIHTLGHPALPHDDFSKWSRWYQEDGNTQIFRLFKGEENTSNKRKLAARVEAFIPSQKWLPEPGVVREFGARFTVIKPDGCGAPHHCSIFQAKGNNVDHWSVMLRVDNNGALWFHPRRGIGDENNISRKLIANNVTGRPFDLKILDDGLNYEMLIDGQSVGTGQWQRTKEIGFRWGIYVGESKVIDDIVVLVTGASME